MDYRDCPVCRRKVGVNSRGTLRSHVDANWAWSRICPGSGVHVPPADKGR